MATYKKLTIELEPFQEGNRAEIVIDIDASKLSLTGIAASCELRNRVGRLIWRKKTTDTNPTIAISGQRVTISLSPADTTGKPGIHTFELDFINAQNEPFATIAAQLTVEPQSNTNG